VVHSRDEEGYGDKPQSKIHLKSVTIFLDNDWLGKTKPKQAFRSTLHAFKKLLRNLKKLS